MFDFPNAPTVGQQVTSGAAIYTWDGVKWSYGIGAIAYLPLSGGTMLGPLILARAPQQALEAATKAYADTMVPLAGGTMTGLLVLSGDATQPMGAVTKSYVDGRSGVTSFNTRVGAITLTSGDVSALGFYTGTASDARYVYKTGDTVTGPLTVNAALRTMGGNIMAVRSTGDISVGAWRQDKGAGGILIGGNAELIFAQLDANGNWVATRGYFDTSNNFYSSAAVTGNYLHSTGDVRADATLRCGGSGVNGWGLQSGVPGGGYWMGFNWDGTNVPAYANGNYACTLVSSTWVSNNFKAIGAYTPNQNVDWGQSPTFGNMVMNGGSGTKWVSNYMRFSWNGRVQCWVDGGGAYVELRDTRDYTPNQNVDWGASPIWNYVYCGNSGERYFAANVGAGVVLQFQGSWFFDWNWSNGNLSWNAGGSTAFLFWAITENVVRSARGPLGGIGGYLDYSDERAKLEMEPTKIGLEEILRLNPIRFRRPNPPIAAPPAKEHPSSRNIIEIGFGARAVREVIPEAVRITDIILPDGSGGLDSNDPALSYSTTPIVAALVNAVKELAARIEHIEGIIT